MDNKSLEELKDDGISLRSALEMKSCYFSRMNKKHQESKIKLVQELLDEQYFVGLPSEKNNMEKVKIGLKEFIKGKIEKRVVGEYDVYIVGSFIHYGFLRKISDIDIVVWNKCGVNEHKEYKNEIFKKSGKTKFFSALYSKTMFKTTISDSLQLIYVSEDRKFGFFPTKVLYFKSNRKRRSLSRYFSEKMKDGERRWLTSRISRFSFQSLFSHTSSPGGKGVIHHLTKVFFDLTFVFGERKSEDFLLSEKYFEIFLKWKNSPKPLAGKEYQNLLKQLGDIKDSRVKRTRFDLLFYLLMSEYIALQRKKNSKISNADSFFSKLVHYPQTVLCLYFLDSLKTELIAKVVKKFPGKKKKKRKKKKKIKRKIPLEVRFLDYFNNGSCGRKTSMFWSRVLSKEKEEESRIRRLLIEAKKLDSFIDKNLKELPSPVMMSQKVWVPRRWKEDREYEEIKTDSYNCEGERYHCHDYNYYGVHSCGKSTETKRILVSSGYWAPGFYKTIQVPDDYKYHRVLVSLVQHFEGEYPMVLSRIVRENMPRPKSTGRMVRFFSEKFPKLLRKSYLPYCVKNIWNFGIEIMENQNDHEEEEEEEELGESDSQPSGESSEEEENNKKCVSQTDSVECMFCIEHKKSINETIEEMDALKTENQQEIASKNHEILLLKAKRDGFQEDITTLERNLEGSEERIKSLEKELSTMQSERVNLGFQFQAWKEEMVKELYFEQEKGKKLEKDLITSKKNEKEFFNLYNRLQSKLEKNGIPFGERKKNIGRFAFLMGQNQGGLLCCVYDSEKMMKILSSEEFGYECNLVADLTREDTVDIFSQFLQKIQTSEFEECNVVIYFSGHGFVNPSSGKQCWKCKDGCPNYVELEYDILKKVEKLTKKVNVFVVIDACRKVLTRDPREKGDEDDEPVTFLPCPNVANYEKNIVIGFACSKGEAALAGEREDIHSLYTGQLVTEIKNNVPIVRILYNTGNKLKGFLEGCGLKVQRSWVEFNGALDMCL